MVETRSGTNIEPEGPIVPEKNTKETILGPQVQVRAGGPAVRTGMRKRLFGFNDAQLYTLLALVHGSLAVYLVFSCKSAAKFAFGAAADPPEDQHCHLFQIYSSGLATSAAMALALEELARRQQLHTYTADILKLGLFGHMVAAFFLLAYQPMTLTLGWVFVEGLAAAATGMIPAITLFATPADRARVRRDFENFPNWALGALRRGAPRRRYSWLAACYDIITMTVVMAGLAYFFAPRWTLYHTFGYDYGKSAHYLWKQIGAGALLTIVPAATMALKHKADIQSMSTTPARTLNLGLMGTSLGHLLVLGPILAKGHGGFLLPGLVAAWGFSLLTSMLGLAAPEMSQHAEQAAEAAKHE